MSAIKTADVEKLLRANVHEQECVFMSLLIVRSHAMGVVGVYYVCRIDARQACYVELCLILFCRSGGYGESKEGNKGYEAKALCSANMRFF